MLKATNIHNSYNGTEEILKGVDLHIEQGEVVVILGPSGSGKTTLLRCMSFLEKATEGILDFDGKTVVLNSASKKDIKEIRLEMGFVFQSFNLFKNMTVMGNVLESLVTARKMDKKEARERATEVLDKVGMLEFAHKYPDELSGGQQQRAAIARAVAPRPKVIFFDEPTSALDPELKKEVLDVIRKLAKEGITMVVVTHELSFARDIASRAVLIENGVIVEEGEADEFFKNPKNERTKQFLNEF